MREQPLGKGAWVGTAWTGTREKFEVLSRRMQMDPMHALGSEKNEALCVESV